MDDKTLERIFQAFTQEAEPPKPEPTRVIIAVKYWRFREFCIKNRWQKSLVRYATLPDHIAGAVPGRNEIWIEYEWNSAETVSNERMLYMAREFEKRGGVVRYWSLGDDSIRAEF